MIRLNDIAVKFGDFTALHDINVHVKEGEFFTFLGPSGCGKTTTLRTLTGFIEPANGTVVANGKDITHVPIEDRNIGIVFQSYALFPTMTVYDNIAFGLKIKKVKKKEIDQKVRDIAKKVDLSDEQLAKAVSQLSGGQQQRVALARILAYEPDVILLDEPFSALDGFLKDHLQKEMQELLQDYTGTVILVSHSREEIYRFSEELLVLDQGKDVCFGKTQDIFADPGWKAAARLTGCRNITRAVRKDVHTLELPEWETVLHLQRDIPEDICAVGVWEHAFRPVWNSVDGENACGQLAFELESTAKLPEELHCFVQTKGDPVSYVATGEVCGKLESGVLPQALAIPEEAVLLLKE